ncbi:hypothetical protein RJ55_03229 [Drechmeria coniospora]|nr:hypothetical protein RJ55_03229 [Drechmeria coniospora]
MRKGFSAAAYAAASRLFLFTSSFNPPMHDALGGSSLDRGHDQDNTETGQFDINYEKASCKVATALGSITLTDDGRGHDVTPMPPCQRIMADDCPETPVHERIVGLASLSAVGA